MKSLEWQVGAVSIPMEMGEDCAREIAARIRGLEADRVFVLADAQVWRLHSARYEPHLAMTHIECPGAESAKTLATVGALAEQLLAEGVTRRSLLLAMGGGVAGNLTGMAAALLFRGIRFVHLPTTLLAMHDSVTSLKQGVNCGGAKNTLGAYHAPSAIFIDLDFLPSLPPRQLRCGMAELVKNALLFGGDYAASVASALQTRRPAALVELGISAKSRLLRHDPRERGPALIFEYGHTIGHALELGCGGALTHGESIAWGMRCAAWVSRRLGLMPPAEAEAHEQMIGLLGELPRPASADFRDIRARVNRDNKRGLAGHEGLAMVLLRRPGKVVESRGLPLTPVGAADIDAALGELSARWR